MEKWISRSFDFYIDKINLSSLPKNSIQYTELKRAFYGGVSAYHIKILDSFENGVKASELLEITRFDCEQFWKEESNL